VDGQIPHRLMPPEKKSVQREKIYNPYDRDVVVIPPGNSVSKDCKKINGGRFIKDGSMIAVKEEIDIDDRSKRVKTFSMEENNLLLHIEVSLRFRLQDDKAWWLLIRPFYVSDLVVTTYPLQKTDQGHSILLRR
jgi:hypothetical protein